MRRKSGYGKRQQLHDVSAFATEGAGTSGVEEEVETENAVESIKTGKTPIIPTEGMGIHTQNGTYWVWQWQYAGPAANGNGSIFRNGDVTMRVMGPVTKGRYQYPNGYVTFENASGQPINPTTHRTIDNSDFLAHIPLLP